MLHTPCKNKSGGVALKMTVRDFGVMEIRCRCEGNTAQKEMPLPPACSFNFWLSGQAHQTYARSLISAAATTATAATSSPTATSAAGTVAADSGVSLPEDFFLSHRFAKGLQPGILQVVGDSK